MTARAVEKAPSMLGPVLVITGASMWGLETFWRLRLNAHFTADVLVFHEHWLGILLTSPFLYLGLKKGFKGVSKRARASMVLSGVLGSALGTVCFTQTLRLLNPSVANLLLNVQPVVSVAVSWGWLRERPKPAFWPWAVVALACGLALAWDPRAANGTGHLASGLFYAFATAFCWGSSTTFGRGALVEIDYRTATALRYVIGSVATFFVVAGSGHLGHMNFAALARRDVLTDMLQMLFIAGVTPTFLYFAGLARTKASVATFAEMAQTFASLLITWGFLGHALTKMQFIAGTVLLCSVHFINRAIDEAKPKDEVAPAPGLS